MVYCKVLQPESYNGLPEAQEVTDFIKDSLFRYEHEHRKWEYGLAVKLVRERRPKSVLNVGGGSSPLSSMIIETVPYVTEIDPTPGAQYPNIAYIYDNFPSPGLTGKFDVVLCTSVIEHVENDWQFFRALLAQTKDTLFITTDFHPSGKAQSPAHYRTYNKSDIEDLMDIAYDEFNFLPLGEPTYEYKVPMVYDYTFASLALVKVPYDI